jgi:hypothetical protein
MHIISLYLVLHTYTTTFDVLCVKKNRNNQTGLVRVGFPLSSSTDGGVPVPAEQGRAGALVCPLLQWRHPYPSISLFIVLLCLLLLSVIVI